MKKISLFLLGLLAVAFITSCNKDDNGKLQSNTADLSFSILPGGDPNGLKSTPCFNENKSGNYVIVTLQKGAETPLDYRLDVFYIGDQPYTNTLKLEPGDYTIRDFVLWNDNMTPGTTSSTTSDDKVVAAAVHTGAVYASLVTSPLTQSFTVAAFKKNTMSVELVCYEESNYASFGFEYFHLDQTIIREQYFFGDICITDVDDYNGNHTGGNSLYKDRLGINNVLLDLPAIFQIEVWRNGVLVETYNNELIPGLAQPLKVPYADPEGIDNYEFKLSILVRKDNGFAYVYMRSWTFSDAGRIVPVMGPGEDGVVDFVLGSCVPDADFVIPPSVTPPPPPPPPSNCEITRSNGGGFTTTIQSVICSGGKYTITLRVEHNGCSGPTCKELSHFSVQALEHTYNNVIFNRISGGMTYSNIDLGPNLGSDPFNGFKIDGVNGIGDGDAGSFTITYTLTGPLQDQQVSAKAGTEGQIASFAVADFISVMNCNNTGCK